MRRPFVALALLAALAGDPAPARACADCMLDNAVFAGVDGEGRLATVSEESEGESDYRAVWLLRISRGTTPVCTAEAMVDDASTSYAATGDKDCEVLLGLGPKDRDPERTTGKERVYGGRKLERADLIAKVRARFSEGLVPVPAPAGVGIEPVANADGYNGETRQQPVTIDGVQVGHVSAGASQWALTAYTNPRFDGVVLRLITLIGSPAPHLGSSSGCTDYSDGYLAVPRNRIEAARLIAKARAAPTPAESLALATRAVELDPGWSGAQNELRRRQRRVRSK